MSGICKVHGYHDPDCNRCTALPYDSHYEEHMTIIDVNLTQKEQLFLFGEIMRLNCRPSDYFKHTLNEFLDNLPVTKETDNPDVGKQSQIRKRKAKSKKSTR